MSDNIIIGVHGQAQTLEGINGINAKEATGGSTNYVPENTLMVGGKTIIENGTYNAGDDNMMGYKRVVVMDLASEGQTKAYQDTRKHNVMIACGGRQRVFSGVKMLCAKDTDDMNYIVAPSPVLRTKSLSVSHPGVYDVSSETDADVYTPVYVSVSDSERDAAGFNPENPTWQDNLPDEIRVTTPPTKTEYNEGEEIDYTGMVVKAYKNGSVWSNENYPEGVIPFEELELELNNIYSVFGSPGNSTFVKFDQSLIPQYADKSWIPDGFYISKSNQFYNYSIEAGASEYSPPYPTHCWCRGYIGYKSGEWSPSSGITDNELILVCFYNENVGHDTCNIIFFYIGIGETDGMYDQSGSAVNLYDVSFETAMEMAKKGFETNMESDSSIKYSNLTRTFIYGDISAKYMKSGMASNYIIYDNVDLSTRRRYMYCEDLPITKISDFISDLANTKKYNDAILYSVFFSPRGKPIKWKRPVDNVVLTTSVWFNTNLAVGA